MEPTMGSASSMKSGRKRIQHVQLENRTEAVWWCGAALQLQDLNCYPENSEVQFNYPVE